MSESTPLLSTSQPSSNAYYFLQRKNDEKPVLVDILPDGSAREEFASRPVNVAQPKVSNSPLAKNVSSPKGESKPGGLVSFLLGKRQQQNRSAFEPAISSGAAAMLKSRQAAVKVEPKVFFSNERTFLAWLHTSVLLAGASIAITSFSNTKNPYSYVYGMLLLPVAIAFIAYSMFQYTKRAAMIRRRAPGPYEDLVGPTVLGVALIISIVLQFSLKFYTMITKV